MEFSIVIPTCNRAKKLKTLLKSILGQTVLPKEAIIIDQSDNPWSANLADKMKTVFLDKGIFLKYVRINEKSGSKARNLGVQHTTGEILFFLDDDVVLERDYVEKILKIYEKFPDAVGVQGLILTPGASSSKTMSCHSHLKNLVWRVFFLSHYRNNKWIIMPSVNDVFPRTLTTTIPCERLQGCSSYKRDVFKNFSFDDNLKQWSFLEDFDFSHRIYKSRIGSLYITPYAKLLHEQSKYAETHKKIKIYQMTIYRTYVFFKTIEQTFYNRVIFGWSMFGSFITTLGGCIVRRKPKEAWWNSIFMFKAYIYALRHLQSIKQMNLDFFDRILDRSR